MKELRNILVENLGQNVVLSVGNCKLLPFDEDFSLELNQHSPGFFYVKKNNICIYLFDSTKVNEYSIIIKDSKIQEIKWDNHRMVLK